MSSRLSQLESVEVHEIYSSIQGESSRVGLPTTFVRLSRCNLRCTWCDTPQAFAGGTKMSIESIVSAVQNEGVPFVCITGGEPLLQKSTLPLMSALCDVGFQLSLETSGERDISDVDRRVKRVMDLKAPGSGECERNRFENIRQLRAHDEVKFVLADRDDFEWMKNCCEEYDLANKCGEVLVSPVWGSLDEKTLVSWIVELPFRVRMQVQLHKFIWGEKQGV